MQIITRYLTIATDGHRVIHTEKPSTAHQILYQLTADDGNLLINGRVGLKVVDTYDPSVWYEVEDPGDDRYNEATIEDYKAMLRSLGVDV